MLERSRTTAGELGAPTLPVSLTGARVKAFTASATGVNVAVGGGSAFPSIVTAFTTFPAAVTVAPVGFSAFVAVVADLTASFTSFPVTARTPSGLGAVFAGSVGTTARSLLDAPLTLTRSGSEGCT
jgi:hypothetical protein